MSDLGNKKIMSENINFYMKKMGVDRNKLSSDLNISYTTISDWINAKTYPRIDKIELMANYFNVNKSQLVEKAGTFEESNNFDILSIYNQLNEPNQAKVYNFAEKTLEEQNTNVIDLREYRDIDIQSTVSAGTGVVDLDANHIERISYNGFIPNKYDAAFRVQGDSMEPVFQDGEIVFVVKDEDVRNGQIGVVLIDGEAFIKKMYVEGDKLRLVSLNRLYEDIIANGSNEISVYGRVVL